MNQRQVIADIDKCIGCGLCSEVCATHNLVVNNNKVNSVMNHCVMCGQCSAICPKGGFSMAEFEKYQEHLQYTHIKTLQI